MIKQFVVMSGRFIYMAGTPSTPGGGGSPVTPTGPEAAEEITLQNIREKIADLVDHKLDLKQAKKILFILDKGTDGDKEFTLKLFKRMVAEDKDGAWLTTLLPRVEKAEEKEEGEKPEGGETPETVETKEGEAVKEGPEAQEEAKPEITEITRDINSDITGLLGEQQKMASSLEARGGVVPEKATARIRQLGTDIEALDKLAKDNIKPLKALLDQHVKDNRIDKKTAIKIINLHSNAKNFDKRFKQLTEKLSKEEQDAILNELKQLEEREKKIHEDFTKRSGEASEILNSMTTEMLNKIEQQDAIDRLERLTGIPIKVGAKLRFKGRNPANPSKEDGLTIAEITAVEFEDIEVKDSNGNTVKQPGITPSITMKWNPVDEEDLGQCTYSSLVFKRKVDWQDICPMINALTEEKLPENERGQNLSLETFLKENVAVGDTFEIREQTLTPDNKPTGTNKKVKVIAIDENAKTITLDQDVLTADLPDPKREKVLSFDSFAKWFRRAEAVREIASLSKLRQMLKELQQKRNQFYADKDSGEPRPESAFPPIEVTKGERLKYDTPENPSFFEIKDFNDKEITLTDGTTFTPGTFYNWVKNHEVEKVTPENTSKKEEEQAKLPSATEEEVEAEKLSVRPDEVKALTADQKPKKSKSWIGQVWKDTRFLSYFDMKFLVQRYTKFFLGKKIRKIKTHQIETARMLGHASDFMFRAVGQKPSAAREWEADAQSDLQKLEMEKVGKLKETMKEYGVFQLRSTLYQGISKDYCRACLEILADKGEIRWDDKQMWAAVTKAGEKDVGLAVTNEESLIYVMDKTWGEGMYHGLRNKNDSTYNSHRSTFQDMAERIGSDPNNTGGLGGALRMLLYKHLQGEYVNPAEYEAYLTYAMDAGKLTFDQKLYFLIMGLGARGKKPNIEGWKGDKGMTLLSLDRYSKIESGFLNKFPIVQYFLTDTPRLDENDEPVYKVFKTKDGKIYKEQATGPYTIGNYAKVIREKIVDDLSKISNPDDCKPTESFKEFIKKDMVWDPTFKVRVAEKASKNVSNWDHDDMDMFGPMMSEANVKLITAIQGSAEQKASIAAQKNVYVGFNDYTHTTLDMMKDALEKDDKDGAQINIKRMIHFLRSFVRYDAIMTSRYQHDNPNFSRLSNQDLNEKAGVDGSRQIVAHIAEMRHLIGAIAERVGVGTSWQQVIAKVNINDDKAKKVQSNSVEEFGTTLEIAIGEYIKANGALAFARMINDIETRAGDLRVKGNLGRPENRQKEKEVAEKETSLATMDSDSIKQKVATLHELRAGKYTTQAELAKRDQNRLEDVLKYVESDQFSKVTREDIELIDSAIASLQQKLEADASSRAKAKTAKPQKNEGSEKE